MPRERRRNRGVRPSGLDFEALRQHYIEQLPMIAALLAAEGDSTEAVDEALDLIEASLEAIQDEES